MLTARCPGCGAPCPASLASPDELWCAACGRRGPPSPEAAAALREAAAIVASIGASERQLGAAQRARLASSLRSTLFRALALAFGVLVLCPMVIRRPRSSKLEELGVAHAALDEGRLPGRPSASLPGRARAGAHGSESTGRMLGSKRIVPRPGNMISRSLA